jgi:hypothetical protein
VTETSVVPPTLQEETTEALLSRLGNLGRMHAQLTADACGRAIDHDDLVDAITSTMRVIDCVLLDRGAYAEHVVRDRRGKALTAAGLSTELRRWVDDTEIRTEDPGPTDEWLERASIGPVRPGPVARCEPERARRRRDV